MPCTLKSVPAVVVPMPVLPVSTEVPFTVRLLVTMMLLPTEVAKTDPPTASTAPTTRPAIINEGLCLLK